MRRVESSGMAAPLDGESSSAPVGLDFFQVVSASPGLKFRLAWAAFFLLALPTAVAMTFGVEARHALGALVAVIFGFPLAYFLTWGIRFRVGGRIDEDRGAALSVLEEARVAWIVVKVLTYIATIFAAIATLVSLLY